MITYKLPDVRNFEKVINGKKSHLIVLENGRGMQVALTDYGARIVSILVPDKSGALRDVVLGFDSIDGYLQAAEPYHGATVGRFANRIANGRFGIGESTFQVEPNNGPNALHGGRDGFHNKVWDRRVNYLKKAEFYYVSPNGEEGFPGTLSVVVQYQLNDNNELLISYHAKTDAPTVVNLTNHAFFNLDGEGAGSIRQHSVQLHAKNYLPVDTDQIPTGERELVAGTPFDFNKLKTLGRDIEESHEQLRIGHGYDHSFVLDRNPDGDLAIAATAVSEESGICLDVLTTEPAVQLYTGNFLNGKDIGKSGIVYEKQHAFCLETQHFPDSPNQPAFPSTLLMPGKVFRSDTVYRFSLAK